MTENHQDSGGGVRLARFLSRTVPPCPVKDCGGDVVAEFMPHDGALLAVYRCTACGGVWDHKGQPLGHLVPNTEAETKP